MGKKNMISLANYWIDITQKGRGKVYEKNGRRFIHTGYIEFTRSAIDEQLYQEYLKRKAQARTDNPWDLDDKQ